MIDAFGAGISSIMLGMVLIQFSSYIGLDKNVLLILAFFPILFFVFDIYSIKTIDKNLIVKLKTIACLNFIYTLFSIIILLIHIEKIKTIGLIYFVGEIFILYILIYFQLKISRQINNTN